MIDLAAERGQITASTAGAHMLRRQRNHVMHKGFWEERIQSNVAAQAIRNLGTVLQELGGP